MVQPAFIRGPVVLGSGWPWSGTGPQSATDAELVKAKITLILFTPIGAHKMEPTFGSNVNALVFENRGPVLQASADLEIRGALAAWLPDVQVLRVLVTEDDDIEGLVTIDVDYLYLGQPQTWTGVFNSVTGEVGAT